MLGTVLAGPAAQARATVAPVAPVVVRGCSAVAGAKALGYYYADAKVRVYACGARPAWDGKKNDSGPVVLPYAGSMTYYRGFQCIELVARYLKARFNADAGYANGAQAVDRYARDLPEQVPQDRQRHQGPGTAQGGRAQPVQDRRFNDVGHTGIVISSSVSSAGNGSVLRSGAELGRRRRDASATTGTS